MSVVSDGDEVRPPSSAPRRRDDFGLIAKVLVATLSFVGTLRRRLAYRESAEFANAGPPQRPSLKDLFAAIPFESEYPYVDTPDYRMVDDLPRDQVNLVRWTLALREAASSLSELPGVDAINYGFVEAKGPKGGHRKLRLAVILYVERAAPLKRFPLFLDVGFNTFPVVVRPKPKDTPAATLEFPAGVATCDARFEQRDCVMTAAHVFDEHNDPWAIRAGDLVACIDSASGQEVKRRVLATDGVLDVALVESPRGPGGGAAVARAFPIAGYLPVEVATPSGPVRAQVVEMNLPEGVIPGEAGKAPNSAATLFTDVTGEHGWSGSMVREVAFREHYGAGYPAAPYGMFMGTRTMHKGVLGRVNMLRQHEIVLGVEILD